MRKKVDPRRLEHLEASVRRLKIEDAKKRHRESYSKMSDEEVARNYLAIMQIKKVVKEDPCKGEKLLKGGLAAIEHFEEKARPGWRRFCETGGHAALMDFLEATNAGKESCSATRSELEFFFEKGDFRNRLASIKSHVKRLT